MLALRRFEYRLTMAPSTSFNEVVFEALSQHNYENWSVLVKNIYGKVL